MAQCSITTEDHIFSTLGKVSIYFSIRQLRRKIYCKAADLCSFCRAQVGKRGSGVAVRGLWFTSNH